MRAFHTLLLFLLCANVAYSQMEISGTVVDKETGDPIPFVNIGIKKLAIGTVSDEHGRYQLSLKNVNDVVTFSSIGFEVVDRMGSELLAQRVIALIPKKYDLHAVEIIAHKYEGKDQRYGVKNKNRGLSIGFGSRQLGTEVGALIQIKEPTYIKSANFVLNHAKGDSLLFRVNIYDYQNKEVGSKILKEDIFIKSKQRKGTITVDLSTYNLVLENDVLLSLEWIRDDRGQGNMGITFDTKKSRKLKGVWIKKTSLGRFERMPHIKSTLKPCFYFIGKKIGK